MICLLSTVDIQNYETHRILQTGEINELNDFKFFLRNSFFLSHNDILRVRVTVKRKVSPSPMLLVIGGIQLAIYSASSEIDDPSANRWDTMRSMTKARRFHTSILIRFFR
jgi:hypothetical protein